MPTVSGTGVRECVLNMGGCLLGHRGLWGHMSVGPLQTPRAPPLAPVPRVFWDGCRAC